MSVILLPRFFGLPGPAPVFGGAAVLGAKLVEISSDLEATRFP
jgi:hypothetical protein